MTSGHVFRRNDRGAALVAALAAGGCLTLPGYTLVLAEGVARAAAERPAIWLMGASILAVAALAVAIDPAPRAGSLMVRAGAAVLLALLTTALVERLVASLSDTDVGAGAAMLASIASSALLLGVGLFAIWRASSGMIALSLTAYAALFQAAVLVQGRAVPSPESLAVPAGTAVTIITLAVIRASFRTNAQSPDTPEERGRS